MDGVEFEYSFLWTDLTSFSHKTKNLFKLFYIVKGLTLEFKSLKKHF